MGEEEKMGRGTRRSGEGSHMKQKNGVGSGNGEEMGGKD